MATEGPTADFISHLPGGITDNILLRLPLQEAVRTSILSKNWRYKWITIPHLLFDTSTFSSVSKSELLTIIHQVLLQHHGPISIFLLNLSHLGSCPEIVHWISFLSRKGIEDFTLFVGETHNIPSILFSCLKLKLLCLHKCVLKPPADFAGFAKLTNLELHSVDLPHSFAETFVAKCPLLESLKLHECSNLDRIDFDAPNLQLLDYQGRISSISFKSTPSLKKVSLESVHVLSIPWKDNTWIDTFCLLPSLEYLRLGGYLCLVLAAGIGRDILSSKLKCLKTLVLDLSIVAPKTTRCTLCLIKSSPNLQKLVIDWTPLPQQDNDNDFDIDYEIQFSKLKESCDFSLEKLQSIEMSRFRGLGPHMAFTELLLAKSPVLETMHIYHLTGWSVDQENTALRKINQVPRASPRAKVIFLKAS